MRILIAEDEPVSQRLLARVLTGMGHEVVATSDGDEAWRAFKKAPFRVVVTDWMMPGADGLELTRRIRTARGRDYTWIVMLTAMDFGSNFRRAMEDGVDDFLTKPLDHELLRVRLTVAERILRMGEQVNALTSALPICMHCKAVRDGLDRWKRIEDFFHDIDFSHSYCPDCFYEHSLAPELVRYRSCGHVPAPDLTSTLDKGVVSALLEFEERDSPGLFDDLCEGIAESARLLRVDLQSFAGSGLLTEELRKRTQRFRDRCLDLGAGRMVLQLDRLLALTPQDQLAAHADVAAEAIAALDATLDAIVERKAARASAAAPTTAASAAPASGAPPLAPPR